MLNTKSTRLQNQFKDSYRTKDKEVTKSARRDKRAFLEEKADQAEQAALRGDLNMVYKITKELCNTNSNQTIPIKDKDGNTIIKDKPKDGCNILLKF